MKTKAETILSRRWVVCPLALLCCLLWGSGFPCVKISYRLFQIAADDVASQIFLAGIRFLLAGILVLAIGSVTARRLLMPKKTSWGMIGSLSLFQTILQYLFFYIGLAHTTGVKGSIIEAANVFVSILFASLVLRQEALTRRKIIGCVIGFAGVVLINLTGTGLSGGVTLLGEGFVFFSTTAYAVSTALFKGYSLREEPIILSGWQFCFGGAFMLVVGLAMGGRLNPLNGGAWGILAYMAMLSAVAYSIWGLLLRYNPVSQVTVYGFSNPLFGFLLSTYLLGEGTQISWVQSLTALALVCGGILIINMAGKKTA